jgi:hypothetical protein
MGHEGTEWVDFAQDKTPSLYVTDREFFDWMRDSQLELG